MTTNYTVNLDGLSPQELGLEIRCVKCLEVKKKEMFWSITESLCISCFNEDKFKSPQNYYNMDKDLIDRNCLKCEIPFKTRNKFIRLCGNCKANNTRHHLINNCAV